MLAKGSVPCSLPFFAPESLRGSIHAQICVGAPRVAACARYPVCARMAGALDGLTELPFQVQIRFTRRDGVKCVRSITSFQVGVVCAFVCLRAFVVYVYVHTRSPTGSRALMHPFVSAMLVRRVGTLEGEAGPTPDQALAEGSIAASRA